MDTKLSLNKLYLLVKYVSDSCTVLSGVPQESVLGPLLFLCYINGLPKYVKSCITLYADDALIYQEIRSTEDQYILLQDLCMLTQWANTWKMTFNALKSEDHKQTIPTYFLLLRIHEWFTHTAARSCQISWSDYR